MIDTSKPDVEAPMKDCRIDLRTVADKAGISLIPARKHMHNVRLTPLLAGLPPPIFRYPKMLWLQSDVDAWLANQSTLNKSAPPPEQQSADAPKRGRGRTRR